MYRKLALALAVTALTACGGGSGSGNGGGGSSSSSSSSSGGGSSSSSSSSSGGSSSSSSSGGNGSPISVGGTAAKGIIAGATVEAYSAAEVLLGSAITGADGSYVIELNDASFSGPIKLVLKQPQDGGAMVTCDVAECRAAGEGDQDSDEDGVIEFGEKYALDYELSAVTVVDETATEISASITALTTLVAEKAGTVLTPASISAANTFVKDSLGLDADPITIVPVDLTSATEADEQALRFALVNAAVEASAEGGDVSAQIDSLSAGFESNTVDAAALNAVSAAIEGVAAATSAGNEALGGVEDAAAAAEVDAGAAIAENCDGRDTCNPAVEVDAELASNLDAAKALVATARKVSIEAIEAIDAELDGEADTYNPDNIVAKLQSAENLLNEDMQSVMTAFSEVSDVFVNQISAVEFGVEPTLESPAATLPEAAGYLWDKYLGDTDYADREDAVAHFPAGTITKSGVQWTLTNGVYDLDGSASTTDDQVAVNLTISIPELSGEPGSLALTAGENSLAIEGSAELGDAKFALSDASKVNLTLGEQFGEGSESEPKIDSISVVVDGSLENAAHGFSGTVEFALRKSSALEENSPDNQTLSLLPEKLALRGAFTDKVAETSLEASVILTVDNVADYWYLAEGTEREDLTSYVYEPTDNTLTITHGDDSNYAVVRYSYAPSADELNYDHYIGVECVEQVGNSACPQLDQYWFWGLNQEVMNVTQEACESGEINGWWEDELGKCFHGVTPEFTNIAQDIRVAFTNDHTELLDGLEVHLAGEGVYGVGPGDWWPDYITDSIFDEVSGEVVASLTESDLDVNEDGRYVKATFRINANGKLSADLPDMDVELILKRTGFELGDASLTLTWGSDLLRIAIDYVGEETNTMVLSDGSGTEFTLELFEDDTVAGTISKDGTVYGTLSEENNIYLITWIDNAIETLL
ncbi:hypothetical protein [Microbulbifer sp. ALW1]|uniref:hypothetical protein n=1 Tax=Microbulbifer sp. (strain ALW1) TaxID=1516059 RepID=UPI001911F90A|nr:hypothetical protein [Microbulbifer sp. ALW1]